MQLLYIGTLTAWQGIETLLTAVSLARRDFPMVLRLIGPTSRTRRQELERLLYRLDLQGVVRFLGPYPQAALNSFLHSSHAAIVPLLPVDRNTQQGCCPLKMLEAMAAGCPVIAADLPVVRELAAAGVHFLPVRPGDARSLKEAILQLAADPLLGCRLARQARERVATAFTWDNATQRLYDVYDRLLGSSARIAARRASSAASE
jgi:glycosyltransferase involved in cell wall biosynthesis